MISKILRASLSGALIFMLSGMTLLSATIAEPDSAPSVAHVKANRNLLETGDVLIYGEYTLPYASIPTIGADESYVMQLLNGETVLGTASIYVLIDNGYKVGVFSFYFSAADNLTWGQAYTIRISQTPTQFASPQKWDMVMITSSSVWSSSTDTDVNQTQLATNVIAAAKRMNTSHSDYDFLDTAVGGTVLSSPTGETYFRGAIYGIQAMAPSLFVVQTFDASTTANYTVAQANTYRDRFNGTWVGDSVNATANQFGMGTTSIMGFIVGIPLVLGVIILSAMRFRKTEPGVMVAGVIIEMVFLLGWFSPALFATIMQLNAMYVGYVLFLSRSS